MKRIDQLREIPYINEVRKEASKLDILLTKQQAIFYHKLALIHDFSNTNDSLVNQMFDLRTFYEEINEKISECIDCQDSAQGRLADLPLAVSCHVRKPAIFSSISSK